MDEVLAECRNENGEGLPRDGSRPAQAFVAKSALVEVLRALQEIRSASGFLGFSCLESVTHAGEAK